VAAVAPVRPRAKTAAPPREAQASPRCSPLGPLWLSTTLERALAGKALPVPAATEREPVLRRRARARAGPPRRTRGKPLVVICGSRGVWVLSKGVEKASLSTRTRSGALILFH
jgi:hypothetical protein